MLLGSGPPKNIVEMGEDGVNPKCVKVKFTPNAQSFLPKMRNSGVYLNACG